MNNYQTGKLKIPIYVREYAGISREVPEAVSLGVPLCLGDVTTIEEIALYSDSGTVTPCQKKILALWPDGSIKWILLDFFVTIDGNRETTFWLERDHGELCNPADIAIDTTQLSGQQGQLTVDTGAGLFYVDSTRHFLFQWSDNEGREDQKLPCEAFLTDLSGQILQPEIQKIVVQENGAIKTVVHLSGCFSSKSGRLFCLFSCDITLFSGKNFVAINVTLHNPDAVTHPGGLWDLGDQASRFFRDFRLIIRSKNTEPIHLSCAQDGEDLSSYIVNSSFEIYQESSGGKNWHSSNHVNKDGVVPLSFRGYTIEEDARKTYAGLRASPVISLMTASGRKISGGIRKFWQNFPKSIKVDQNGLILKLFPDNFPDNHELQGGEQKTHTLCFDFSSTPENERSFMGWVNHPLTCSVSPKWYEQTKVFSYFHLRPWSADGKVDAWIKGVVEGDDSFLAQREIIDEYGWRNFGDVFASHEILEQLNPPESLISHYNNQYDILNSSLLQFARTKNQCWFELGADLATHLIDIDIYRTEGDRVEFNNGLFWHTNHFMDAATATHRAMSREHLKIVGNNNYGGGPSLEHNYITGLITFYYMTGNRLARETAVNIGNLVLKRLHGSNIFLENLEKLVRGIIKRLREKYCKNVELDSYDMHNGPGRGSGNSLSVLLDVYSLTHEKKYLLSAEKIIRACIHPKDSIEDRKLLNAEFRWTYTIFLQALVKYIDIKLLHNETDKMFLYARKCLIVYAEWMVKNEYPFLDAPDKLDAPNFATRSAQELRKVNVLLLAAHYTRQKKKAEQFRQKARFFFERTVTDLEELPTRRAARPMAILLQNGSVYSWINNNELEKSGLSSLSEIPDVDFGKPSGDSLPFFVSLRLPSFFSSLIRLNIGREVEWAKRRYAELRKTGQEG